MIDYENQNNAARFKLCPSYGSCKINCGTWEKMIMFILHHSNFPTIDVDPKWKDFKESNEPVLTIDNN